MIANLSWNSEKRAKGILGEKSGWVNIPTPRYMKNVIGFPMTPPIESPKARLNPKATQVTNHTEGHKRLKHGG